MYRQLFKYSMLLTVFFSCPGMLTAQFAGVKKEMPAIQKWFARCRQVIDSSKEFFLLPAYTGDGFCVRILPEKKYSNDYSAFMREWSSEKEEDSSIREEIELWSLINEKDSLNGFAFTQLADSVRVPPNIEETDGSPGSGKVEITDSAKVLVHYIAVVFYGQHRRLFLPPIQKKRSLGDRWYVLFISDRYKTKYLPAEALDCNVYNDYEKQKAVAYLFIPRKLSNPANYGIDFEVMEGGDIHVANTGTISFTKLQTYKWFTITVESVPANCTVYMIPQDEYDLAYYADRRFDQLKKNKYRLSPADTDLETFLETFILSEGPTNTEVSSREINYIFFIRKGDQLSKPLSCKPGPGKINKVKWAFSGL